MELRELRGYLNDNLVCSFPLHWVDEIICCDDGTMIVNYYDELDEENRDYNSKVTTIELNYINIK